MTHNCKDDKPMLISLGVITKVRGNKGEVVIGLSSRQKDHFSSIRRVVVRQAADAEIECAVEKMWFHREKLIAKFKGCDTIEDASKLVGREVLIESSELKPPDEDYFYVFQLIGLKVYYEGGGFLGNIVDILATGGTDVLVIKDAEKEYLIPMAEEYIEKLDSKNRILIIKPPEGLLEINEI